MKRASIALLAASLLGALGCDGARRETSAPSTPGAAITIGGRKLEIAMILTEKDRRHAVGALTSPGEARGVLLAWPRERFMKIESERSGVAWDVAFLDRSGTIVDLLPLPAQDVEGIMPRTPAAYALLLASGMGQKLGLKSGDKATLSAELLAAKPEELPEIKINGVVAHIELALTEAERQHGLMFRPRLSTDDGMLFAYTEESHRSFWMKNTLIPLDIAFFTADGTLLNVNETPIVENPRVGPWPGSPSKGEARYVLEMNLGWFKRKGLVDGSGNIVPGTKAEIPAWAAQGASD